MNCADASASKVLKCVSAEEITRVMKHKPLHCWEKDAVEVWWLSWTRQNYQGHPAESFGATTWMNVKSSQDYDCA
jgi:hypothetical protein